MRHTLAFLIILLLFAFSVFTQSIADDNVPLEEYTVEGVDRSQAKPILLNPQEYPESRTNFDDKKLYEDQTSDTPSGANTVVPETKSTQKKNVYFDKNLRPEVSVQEKKGFGGWLWLILLAAVGLASS